MCKVCISLMITLPVSHHYEKPFESVSSAAHHIAKHASPHMPRRALASHMTTNLRAYLERQPATTTHPTKPDACMWQPRQP